MIKLEHTEVFGWDASIRGLRNPMNSWDKSDSDWDLRSDKAEPEWFYRIGENDLKLMKSLSKAGNDHSKFLRMINVTVDLTAPFYFWKQFDTFKVGTVANSCSTMHKIHAKKIELEDFSTDNLTEPAKNFLETVVAYLEATRRWYVNEGKNKEDWYDIIGLLPESYNQKRTVQLNYQVLKHMYFSRRYHKLKEWHDFCDWCETLPYFKEICIQEG